MDPHELGTARQTRHSFARQLIRHAHQDGWKVTRRVWDLDEQGCGTAIYSVAMGFHVVELVIFSQVIDESLRTDRVIAQDWDVTSALVDGLFAASDIDDLRRQVTRQEEGRANDRTLIWGRANRSQRFFDYVVECLAEGRQPESENVSDSAYILRSTAFYGNGKWGLRDFEGIDAEHPLATPYRAQMLAAWLLREFSADLAAHCAAQRSSRAVDLDTPWRRFLGLGNATGLGMVPYVIRHPQVLDAWVGLRELPLANALAQAWGSSSAEWSRVCALLERAQKYFVQKKSFSTEPYPSGPELAESLGEVLAWAIEYRDQGTIRESSCSHPAETLHSLAAERGTEVRQIVDSVLVEIDPSMDGDIEALLPCVDRTALDPRMTVGELRELVTKNYGWSAEFDFSQKTETEKFWFYSQNNQEPRRGRRNKDKGLVTEHPVGIAFEAHQLLVALGSCSADLSVGEFVVQHPECWGMAERVQSVSRLPYTEARVNPLSNDFLPLDLQRFQLAVYGMENFNPQSTDWLRVTLFGGAPTCGDIEAGEHVDDWLFLPRPSGVS